VTDKTVVGVERAVVEGDVNGHVDRVRGPVGLALDPKSTGNATCDIWLESGARRSPDLCKHPEKAPFEALIVDQLTGSTETVNGFTGSKTTTCPNSSTARSSSNGNRPRRIQPDSTPPRMPCPGPKPSSGTSTHRFSSAPGRSPWRIHQSGADRSLSPRQTRE
jgi:hypothetical protein